MKFQKGLITDEEKQRHAAAPTDVSAEDKTAQPEAAHHESMDDGHLFETLEEETRGGRKYLKLFSIVVVFVIVAGIAIGYYTLPGVGDVVRAPAGLEVAVRDHFLIKEKRTSTDIVFYQCEGFYSARVGVETRSDIPNPLFRIDTYAARVVSRGEQWEITAEPIESGKQFATCQ